MWCDLDLAIRNLNELRLGSAGGSFSSTSSNPNVAVEANLQLQSQVTSNGEVPSTEDTSTPKSLPIDGSESVDLFVREMTSASNMDDARVRPSRALEVLEKSICARAGVEAAQSFHQENMMLKEQVEALI